MKTAVINFDIMMQCVLLAEASPDKEVCGALLGKKEIEIGGIRCINHTRFIPLTNVTEVNQAVHYIPDPQEMFNVLNQTTHVHDEAEWDLTGIFHSHPNNRPVPSMTDIQGAGYAGNYIIYSNLTKNISSQYYAGDEKGFEELKLIVNGIERYNSIREE